MYMSVCMHIYTHTTATTTATTTTTTTTATATTASARAWPRSSLLDQPCCRKPLSSWGVYL